jgi:PleD family two-component response regulator
MERGFSGLNNRTLLKFNVFGRGDSIRRRSLDLLYGMCDISNAKDIVEELLQVSHLFLLEIQLVMHLQ